MGDKNQQIHHILLFYSKKLIIIADTHKGDICVLYNINAVTACTC